MHNLRLKLYQLYQAYESKDNRETGLVVLLDEDLQLMEKMRCEMECGENELG